MSYITATMVTSTEAVVQVAAVNKVEASSSSKSWLRYVLLIFALPFLLGFIISILKFNEVSILVNPTLTKLMSSYTTAQRVLFSRVTSDNTTAMTKGPIMDVDRCFGNLERKMFESIPIWEDLDSVMIMMHRNGQAESCGSTATTGSDTATNGNGNLRPSSLATVFRTVLQELHSLGQPCPDFSNKYQVEAFLTRFFVHALSGQPPSATAAAVCPSEEDDRKNSEFGLYDFCDMGDDKTPILLDHNKMISNIIQSSTGTGSNKQTQHSRLPCHFHTEHGLRVTSLMQFTKLLLQSKVPTDASSNITIERTKTSDCMVSPNGDHTCNAATSDLPTKLNSATNVFHLYAVPAGRVFMHVAAYIGQIIELDHVPGADPAQRVYLKVLSVSPAVFDLFNFFTKDESTELVNRALAEKKESHRIKRSTTGTGEHHVNTRRTSESGFDTDGATSILIKKRCFQVLGFDEYIESHGDGLQILRYNLTTAYIPHMDYLDIDKKLEHDYDSSKKGGNRFATILLYMTDLNEKDGGETVFIDAWPTGQREEDHRPIETSLRELRESDQHGILEEGSWQEKMVAQCRSRLAVRPDSARAVLFYSQLPNGKPDPKSRHGGCPVLSGVKYAANLWVWNTPRDGYSGNPKNPDYKPNKSKEKAKQEEDEVPKGRITATFRNNGKDVRLDNAKLYFYDGATDKEWGALGSGEQLSIFTYKTHVWKVMVDEEVFHIFNIESDTPLEQEFVV